MCEDGDAGGRGSQVVHGVQSRGRGWLTWSGPGRGLKASAAGRPWSAGVGCIAAAGELELRYCSSDHSARRRLRADRRRSDRTAVLPDRAVPQHDHADRLGRDRRRAGLAGLLCRRHGRGLRSHFP